MREGLLAIVRASRAGVNHLGAIFLIMIARGGKKCGLDLALNRKCSAFLM